MMRQKPHIYRQNNSWKVEKSQPSVATSFAHLLFLHNTEIVKNAHKVANERAEEFVMRLNKK